MLEDDRARLAEPRGDEPGERRADERADQVYAVKIRVPNGDGTLRIGMPGEVELAAPR